MRGHPRRQGTPPAAALAGLKRRSPCRPSYTTRRDVTLDKHSDYEAWIKLLNRAGVRHIRLHDGRHTAATLLLAAGVHPRVVMELLGHSQMRTTTDIYSHVMPALAREAADRMGETLWNQAEPLATTLAPSRELIKKEEGKTAGQRCGAEGTRTPDPHTASVVRYQLRHSPKAAQPTAARARPSV